MANLPDPSEFQEEDSLPPGRCPGIYILLDGEEVVYVGQSGDIRTRLRTHRGEGAKSFSQARWYQEFSLPSRVKLEAILILLLLPKYNRGLSLGMDGNRVWEIKWRRNSSPSSSGRRAKSAHKKK
jgi:hypothetical protein